MKKFVTLSSLLAVGTTLVTAAEKQPNIILFLVDDMGVMDTSVPFVTDSKGKYVSSPYNSWYRTPNMEKLASMGVRFSTFYAQSTSSPTRASIMTGQNATRHGVTNWINFSSNNRGEFGPDDWNWKGLTPSMETLPKMLKKGGYKTITVGKAHFAPNSGEGVDPTKLGFDVNVAGSGIGHPGSYYAKLGFGKLTKQKGNAVPGLDSYHGTDAFLTEVLTLEAKKQIDIAVDEKKPFFLYMSHYAVHSPYECHDKFKQNYVGKGKNNQMINFATLIEGMDESLGELMSYLDEKSIAENTLIIFLGDNGTAAPVYNIKSHETATPLRGKKGTEYEGGVRVPFIAAWGKEQKSNPNQQKLPIVKGSLQRQMGTVMDIYPTLLEVAGVSQSKKHTLDGFSLKEQMLGGKNESRSERFLMHFPHQHAGSYFSTLRVGDWKLIYYYNPQNPSMPICELYDLSKDLYEVNNLATTQGAKLKEMLAELTKQLKEEDAKYPQLKNGTKLHPITL